MDADDMLKNLPPSHGAGVPHSDLESKLMDSPIHGSDARVAQPGALEATPTDILGTSPSAKSGHEFDDFDLNFSSKPPAQPSVHFDVDVAAHEGKRSPLDDDDYHVVPQSKRLGGDFGGSGDFLDREDSPIDTMPPKVSSPPFVGSSPSPPRPDSADLLDDFGIGMQSAKDSNVLKTHDEQVPKTPSPQFGITPEKSPSPAVQETTASNRLLDDDDLMGPLGSFDTKPQFQSSVSEKHEEPLFSAAQPVHEEPPVVKKEEQKPLSALRDSPIDDSISNTYSFVDKEDFSEGAEHGSYFESTAKAPPPISSTVPEPLKQEPVASSNLQQSFPKFEEKSAVTEEKREKANISEVSKPVENKPTMSSSGTSGMSGDGKGCPGICALFTPGAIHPLVESLIYWRCPKKSGAAFGAGMVVLLSLAYCSVISVFAYTALTALLGAMGFRIYKNVMQAVQKTGDGHPFKEFLDKDLTLPKDRAHDIADSVMKHGEATILKLRALFLVEDYFESAKLLVGLWLLTYIGSWFNGLTLIILAYIGLFTLPKVYETYQKEIDQYLDLARTQIGGILETVKSKLPMGKKPAADKPKEQ